MKKVFALMICAMLVFTTCAYKANPQEGTPNGQQSGVSETDEAIGPEITLKIGYSTSEEDPRGYASEKFKEIVEEQTEGTSMLRFILQAS